jgi:hypothetical protein
MSIVDGGFERHAVLERGPPGGVGLGDAASFGLGAFECLGRGVLGGDGRRQFGGLGGGSFRLLRLSLLALLVGPHQLGESGDVGVDRRWSDGTGVLMAGGRGLDGVTLATTLGHGAGSCPTAQREGGHEPTLWCQRTGTGSPRRSATITVSLRIITSVADRT